VHQFVKVSCSCEALEGVAIAVTSGASEFVERADLIVGKVFFIEGL